MNAVVPAMTKARALFLVEKIKEKATELRRMLKELHDLRGYLALGYPTWEECVTAEFEKSGSQLYRELAAAKVEENIGVAHVRLSERSLRPLAELPAEYQPMAYEAAKQEAQREGIQTPAERHTRAVADVLGEVIATGGYVSVEGVSTAFHAALTEHQHETLQRQRGYIKEAVAAKHGTQTASVAAKYIEIAPGEGYYHLTLALTKFDAETLQAAIDAGADNIRISARKKD